MGRKRSRSGQRTKANGKGSPPEAASRKGEVARQDEPVRQAEKPPGNPRPAAAEPAGAGPYLLHLPRHPLSWKGLWGTAWAPLEIEQRNWVREIPHLLIVFLFVAALYAYTTPRLVAFEDDGLFLMNMHYFGVAHPPGYPLHTMLGGAFYHLFPFGTPAFKGHFFSGVAGALTCSGVYATIALLTKGRLPAYAGALGFGASMTFWSQAIIAEVYTLNTMMFFLCLPLCIAYASHVGRADTWPHRRLMCLIAFCYGLGLSNHWVLLGIGSLGFGLLVLSQLRHIVRGVPLSGICLALGLLPYLWMVLRSQQDVLVSFYGPISTFEDFKFYVGRSGYSGVDDQLGVGFATKLAFFEHLFTLTVWQFTPIGAALAVLGAWAMARTRHLWVFLALLLTWFMSSIFLVLTINFKADYIWLTAFRVYPLVAYGVMAIWIGYGVAWLASRAQTLGRAWLPRAAAAAAGAAVVGASLLAHWDENNRRNFTWAHDFAMFKLESLEPNTELFTFDDLDVPVGYLHYVEGVRPDINVYNDQGLVFGNRLYSPLSSASEKIRRIRQHVLRSGDRPVYYHPLRTDYFKNEQHGSDLLGFFRRVNKDGPDDRVVLDDRLRQWLDKATQPDANLTDLWTLHQRYTIVATLTQTLLLANTAGYEFVGPWKDAIDRALDTNTLARISAGLTLYRYAQLEGERLQEEWDWTEDAIAGLRDEEHLDGKGRSHLFLYRALLAERQKKREVFESNLLRSLRENQETDNPSLEMLLDYYARAGRKDDFLEVVDRYYLDERAMPERYRRHRTALLRADGAAAAPAAQ